MQLGSTSYVTDDWLSFMIILNVENIGRLAISMRPGKISEYFEGKHTNVELLYIIAPC